MTIPIERTWAVQRTRQFLLDLLDPKKTPRIPKDIRKYACRLLRHYPHDTYLRMASEGNADSFGWSEEAKQ